MRKLFHPGRPAGRLFYCLISVLVAMGVSRGAPPPTPPATTTISDVIYRADGSTAAGTLLITWPAFTTADNRAVPAGSMSLAIGPFGAINLALAPNQGATPAGTYYKVVMKLNDGTTSEEFWVVPTLSPTTISAIRSQVVPAGVAQQTVTRQYVDEQLATKVAKTGDTMTGALTTPGLASARVNSILYADQFASIQAAVTDAGTSGAVVIPPSYAGSDTFTNPNGIPISDLRKTAINVANVKSWGAKGDGRATTHAVTNGTTTVTGDSGTWSASDVGKIIVFFSQTLSPGVVTSIAGFTSSSQITIGTPVASGGSNAVWGTDDGPAISAAAAAITAQGRIGTLYFPQGIYLTSTSIAMINAQGLTIAGDGAGSAASLGNYNGVGQPAVGSSLVWIGSQGGAVGCASATGAPPAGIANAATNCTAAENYMLKVSGQFHVRDLNFQGAQLASHNVWIGGAEASNSFDWSLDRINSGYARQYCLVVGGTGADQGANFGEASIRNLATAGCGVPNTTVAENDATGGGDIFLRYGNGNFQVKVDTSFLGIGGPNGSHHVFAYSGLNPVFDNLFFAPLTANGTSHSSFYGRTGVNYAFQSVYDENGYFLHNAGSAVFQLSRVQIREQAVTNPHQAMLFDIYTQVVMNQVSTAGLPIVFNAGGMINHQQVTTGTLVDAAITATNCTSAGCITRSGSTVTVTTTAAHPFAQGDWVQLDSMADATYNGVFQVASVADNTHFTYVNANAVGASTQGGTSTLASGLVSNPAAKLERTQPFISFRETYNGRSGSLTDIFSANATNPAGKYAFTVIPASVSGVAGQNLPSTIPAGWHFLDWRGTGPTFLGGPFQWGTATNKAKFGINHTPAVDFDVDGTLLYDGATLTAPTFSGSLSGNASTATALAADPADCTGNSFALGINASGAAQCAQPAFSNLSGTAASGQLPATVVYSNQGNTYTAGTQDFESAAVTRPFRRLALAGFPGTCTANREFLERSDPVTAGQVLYVCNSAGNGWDLVGDGGSGGGGGSPYASGGNTANLVPKSNGAGLLVDGSITDNGTTVSSTEFAKFGPASGSFDANSGGTIDAGKHSIATLNPAVAGAGIGQTVVTQDNNTNNIFSQYVLLESNHIAGTRTRARSLEADVYASGSGGTTTNADAITGYAEQDSGATVGSLRGLNTSVQVNTGATAINTALIGLDINAINLDAAITVPLTQGVRISGATKTAGTITTSVGLDILDQTAGATNYAIRTGAGQVSFGDTTSAPILNASTGYRIAGGAASGNVLRGDGTNFVSAALACADVTNCPSLAASGAAGVGPSKAGTASTAARNDHDHRSFHTLTWYFPGTPSTGVSPMILAVPQGIVNGTITGMQVTVATTSASSSSFNLQRCTANCAGASPTFANIYSSDNTLGANTSEADFGATNLTPTLNAKDQFKVNLVTIGSGLANVTITLTYKYDTTN